MSTLPELRDTFHRAMCEQGLYGQRARKGSPVSTVVGGYRYAVYTNADSYNDLSVVIAAGVAERLNVPLKPISSQGSTLGSLFEGVTRRFLVDALDLFSHLQRRKLTIKPGGKNIANFAQYAHLDETQKRVEEDPELRASFGGDYLVTPDTLFGFEPFDDNELSEGGAGLTGNIADRTALRSGNSELPILHATVSCKWTMRRDRAQNTRLEALNLVRNRKGRLPHITAVTMECDPGILSSLALGTGDIDCVYHGALNELLEATEQAAKSNPAWEHTLDELLAMVNGSRLRDISDLPLDLMI